MKLTFTFADYYYFKFYCDHSTTSTYGATDEDKGCSLSDGATFGSVVGVMTLASNRASTPSVGWVTSS